MLCGPRWELSLQQKDAAGCLLRGLVRRGIAAQWLGHKLSTWEDGSALPQTPCMTMGKLCKLSMPQSLM